MTDTAEAAAPTDATEEYAIVEIFGHRRHAGRIQEVDRFGAKLLRIDIPTGGDFANGFTSHFYGGSSIFSMTPTDLATVARINKPYERPALYHMPGLATVEYLDDGALLKVTPTETGKRWVALIAAQQATRKVG